MSIALEGLAGVTCLIDDTHIHGSNQQEHDECLIAVRKQLKKFHVTFNKEKCVFSTCSVKFLNRVIDQEGIKPDTEKLQAIQDMEEPKSVSDLRRFLRMCNQLSKFSSDLAETTKLFRDLFSTRMHGFGIKLTRNHFVMLNPS